MKIPSLLAVATVCSAAALMNGCATMVKGTTQDIPITSDPSGARVQVNGAAAGTTPTTVTLSRKFNHVITLEKEGYETETVAVTKSIGRTTGGNLLAGGIVGWGVDAMSGAQYDLAPATIDARLRTAGTGPATSAAAAQQLVNELNRLDQSLAEQKISADDYVRQRAALFEKYQKP
jgi:hypothetical protein